MKNCLPAQVALTQVDVWFEDEARIGQQGTMTRVWAKKGTRPRVIRQQQYEYAYIFGAVCPGQDKAVGLVMPQVNTAAMQAHLNLVAEQVPKGRHAVIVMDRAGWHTTAKLKSYANLSILLLPPASPELNPTEQLWQQLRDRYLANRCYSGYADIVDSSCDAWNQFVSKPQRIKKLCTREWANLQQ